MSSVAVADVTGDGFGDIVQGDHLDAQPFEGGEPVAGEVRLWLGGRRGPAATPTTITQAPARSSTATRSRETPSGSPSTPATSTATAMPTWSSAHRARTAGAAPSR